MSDRIAVMHDGVLEQLGKPKEIYESPASKFVATFIGETNLFEGMVSGAEGDRVGVTVESGAIQGLGSDFHVNEIVAVTVRPERMCYSESPVEGFQLEGMVKEQVYVGSVLKAIVVLGNGYEVKLERLAGSTLPMGGKVYLYWKPEDARLIHSHDQVVFHAVENVRMG